MTRRHPTDLRRLPVFARLSTRALDLADSLLTPVSLPAGHVLCREGAVGREAFVLVSGTATVVKDGVEVAVVGPGGVVGELALLGDGYRTATVVTATDVVALVMNAREFISLQALPGVGAELTRVADARQAAGAARAA